MKDISRRLFLTTPLVVAGCLNSLAKPFSGALPTNVAENFGEKRININEDLIGMQKVGIFGNFYFAVPLNTEDKVLNYGEPSFALIPEEKSRISIKQVGQKGGEVVVDASEGDEYFPVGYSKDRALTDFSKVKPTRFLTNFKMANIKKPDPKDGKISLETLTEKDLPFSDETLKALNGQEYLVNRIPEELQKNHVLPIYFTKKPITVEYNRAEKDGKIRIVGETYVFIKGSSKEVYFNERGFTNVPEKARDEETSKKKKIEERQIITPDENQD